MQRARIGRGQAPSSRSTLLAQRELRAAGERDRAGDAAVGGRRRGLQLGIIGARARARRHGGARHVGGASGRSVSRRQRERMRRQQPAGRVAHQQKQRARRRLLQHLEQRIGPAGVELVGASTMQTRQPPSPAVEPKNGTAAPDIIDRDLACGAAVCRRSCARAPADRYARCAATRRAAGWSAASASDVAALHRRRGRIGMREHETRHAIGERRLADAGRAADQPGVWHAAAAVGSSSACSASRVAEQHRRLARMRDRGVVGSSLLTRPRPPRPPARLAGSSRSVDRVPDARRPCARALGVDHHAALGSCRRERRDRPPQLL